MIRYIVLVAAGFMLFLGSPVSAQQRITLQQAFEMAIENNHDIRVEMIRREQSDNNLFRGNAGLLPSLDILGDAEFSRSDAELDIADFDSEGPPRVESVIIDGSETRNYNASLQLTYTLFDGFRGRYRFQQLQSQDEATKLRTRIEIENTLLDVADAYLSVLRETENVEILKQNLSLSENRLERAREDRRTGRATELEFLNAEVNYNADVIELSTAEVDLETAVRTLRFRLGMDDDESVQPVDRFETNRGLELQEILNSALQQNAVLLLVEEQLRSAELSRTIAASARYPSVRLRGSYGYFRQEIDASNIPKLETLGVTAGVTLQYNIFNGRQTQRAIENAQLEIKSSREQVLSAQKEVQTDVMNAYSQYQNTLRQIDLSERNVETAQRNFDTSSEAFRLGQITSIELREAQLSLLKESVRHNNLLFSAKQQELLLMVLSGDWMSI